MRSLVLWSIAVRILSETPFSTQPSDSSSAGRHRSRREVDGDRGG